MNVLINASNLFVGGGVQVAVSYISALDVENNCINFKCAVSLPVYSQLPDKAKGYCIYINEKNSGIRDIKNNLAQLDALCKKHCFDKAFSIFGPTYWRPPCHHIVGFANPWVIYPNSKAFSKFGLLMRMKLRLKYFLYRMSFIYEADEYVVEANHVKDGVLQRVSKLKKVTVVPNTLNQVFYNGHGAFEGLNSYDFKDKTIRAVSICHPYPHKNLEIIPDVRDKLRRLGVEVEFNVTISPSVYEGLSGRFKNATSNLGVLSLKDCVEVYQKMDIVFIPTLLECFSASHLEAMAMGLPVFTSDFNFTRDICEESAIYFNPMDPENIAKQMVENLANQSLLNEKVAMGKAAVEKIPDYLSRAQAYNRLLRVES